MQLGKQNPSAGAGSINLLPAKALEIRGIVSAQHGCTSLFDSPHNAVGGNGWRSSWIRKRV